MALNNMGVSDVTGVEIVDSLSLVKRADPNNLPFFDGVFDLAFSAHLEEALFPLRIVGEMERTVRNGGVCVVAVKECGGEEVDAIARLFRKSMFVGAENVTLIGMRMTRIIMRFVSLFLRVENQETAVLVLFLVHFLCQSKKGFKRHNYCLPMKKSKLSVGKYTIFPLMVSNMFGMKLSCLPALANGVWQWRKSQLAIRHLIFQRYGALQCQIYDMALTPSVPKKCSKIFVQSSDIVCP
ncbi:hypothetical protein D5086_025155 [Populus alba]|uniref:Uncharacterized protein n=1 Tax=Populus alba TaxID=43335 RepID=A0ACC4B7I9_POPAL